MHDRIRFARGTKAQRETSTVTPAEGQPVFETDTRKLYIGEKDGNGNLKELKDLVPINTTNKLILHTPTIKELYDCLDKLSERLLRLKLLIPSSQNHMTLSSVSGLEITIKADNTITVRDGSNDSLYVSGTIASNFLDIMKTTNYDEIIFTGYATSYIQGMNSLGGEFITVCGKGDGSQNFPYYWLKIHLKSAILKEENYGTSSYDIINPNYQYYLYDTSSSLSETIPYDFEIFYI